MKKILILIFLTSISFCGYSQSVKLEDLIRYYLKKDDSLQVYKGLNKDKDSVIFQYKEYSKKDSLIISRYKGDSIQYNKLLINKDEILQNKDKELKITTKEHKRQKTNLKLTIFGLILLEVITVLISLNN
jgi:hypothetical protein